MNNSTTPRLEGSEILADVECIHAVVSQFCKDHGVTITASVTNTAFLSSESALDVLWVKLARALRAKNHL